MGYDAFGLFRGWCTRASNCLEYSPAGEAIDAADANPLRCSHCRCLPQEHVPARAEGYDPNSPEQLAERRKYDVRLLPPDERAADFPDFADRASHHAQLLELGEGDVVCFPACWWHHVETTSSLSVSVGCRYAG